MRSLDINYIKTLKCQKGLLRDSKRTKECSRTPTWMLETATQKGILFYFYVCSNYILLVNVIYICEYFTVLVHWWCHNSKVWHHHIMTSLISFIWILILQECYHYILRVMNWIFMLKWIWMQHNKGNFSKVGVNIVCKLLNQLDLT